VLEHHSNRQGHIIAFRLAKLAGYPRQQHCYKISPFRPDSTLVPGYYSCQTGMAKHSTSSIAAATVPGEFAHTEIMIKMLFYRRQGLCALERRKTRP